MADSVPRARNAWLARGALTRPLMFIQFTAPAHRGLTCPSASPHSPPRRRAAHSSRAREGATISTAACACAQLSLPTRRVLWRQWPARSPSPPHSHSARPQGVGSQSHRLHGRERCCARGGPHGSGRGRGGEASVAHHDGHDLFLVQRLPRSELRDLRRSICSKRTSRLPFPPAPRPTGCSDVPSLTAME